MEIAGTVGAAVGLACAVGSVSKALADCISAVRLADRDAYLTQMELATLDHLLMHFDQLVSSHDSQGAQLDEQTDLQTPVIGQGRRLIDEMERVLDEIGILNRDSLQTGRQRWLSKLRWYIRKKEVLGLCVQFNQVKVSLMAFVSLVGLKSMRDELRKVRSELRRLRHERLPGSRQRIAQLEQIREQLERRVEAFNIEVEAVRGSCKMAAREVRQQNLLPEAQDLSEDLYRRVRRISKTVVKKQSDDGSGRRRRQSTSRRTSRRPPSTDGRTTRRRPPPGPTSPPPGSTMVMVPPQSPPPPPPPPPAAAAVHHPDLSDKPENEASQSSSDEGLVAPPITRYPRYFRDFRIEPFPDRPPLTGEQSVDSMVDETTELAESPMGLINGEGAYVNPENPQDRRRRLPNGRLSQG